MPAYDERREEIDRLLRRSAELQRQSEALLQRADRLRREVGKSPAPPTVLVVDDEPFIRAVVGRMLAEAGFRVLTAMSGYDALELLRDVGPVEVVLSDLRMPQMTGAQLAAEVRQLLPTARVVLMAAYPSEDPLDWPVIVKPFPPGVLEAQIRRALDGPDAHHGSGEYPGRIK